MKLRMRAWIAVGCMMAPMLLLSAASAEPGSAAPDLRQEGTYTVRTGPLVQDLGGDVVATVDIGTEIRVLPTTYIKLHPSKPSTRCATIELVKGRMEVEVPPGEPPTHSVQIKTAGGLSAVSLGGRTIAASGKKGVTFANVNGRVLVGKGSKWGEVKEGLAESYAKGELVTTRAIPGVPSLQAQDLLLVAPIGGSVQTQVTPAGESLKWFVVTLSKLEGKSEVQVGRYTTSGAPVALADLSAGQYRMVARGFDEWGLGYRESEAASVHVMNYELPKEAHIVDGRVYLLPGQRLKVLGSKDIEMTYGEQSSYFVPLPVDVGLGATSSQVARFRVKGSSIEGRLEMVARPFKAQIDLSPHAARWPDDLVQVSIRLTNQAGRLAPEAPDVKKLVTINSRRVELSWRNQYGVLVANLPPQAGSGPWKVNVALSDKLGTFASHSTELRRTGAGS